jgi:hypothetical protein
LAENLDFLTLRNFAAGVKALIWHWALWDKIFYCNYVWGLNPETLWSHSFSTQNLNHEKNEHFALPSAWQLLPSAISELIPQSIQLRAEVMLASLGWCHKLGECAKSCARRSVCFCHQSDRVVSTGLLT